MGAPAAPSLDIDVALADLTTESQLKKFMKSKVWPVIKIGAKLHPFWGKPVQEAPNNTSLAMGVSDSATWGINQDLISLTLGGGAKCALKIITSGGVIDYAPDLRSKKTCSLPEGNYADSAYIVLSFDFQISKTVGVSGNADGLGISGNVQGSSDTSFTFCRRVPGTMILRDAIKDAFENFVFPLEPSSALKMNSGDIAQVNFCGTLGLGLDVSYGISQVSFAAPGVASVIDSATKGVGQFTLPSGKINIGADACVNYTHTDDFTAMLHKLAADQAFLYVMRARKNDTSESLTLSAKVEIDVVPKVAVDPQKLQQAVEGITGAGAGKLVTATADALASKLTDKLTDWVNHVAGQGASLGAAWDQHQGTAMLAKYRVNFHDTNLCAQTWNSLCRGNVRNAISGGGLTPEPGSGISEEMSRSFTLSLQFFNLFEAANKTTYFENSYVTLTPTGDIRYLHDIGKEQDADVAKSKNICRIHFVASVDPNNQLVTRENVNLQMELCETHNPKEASRMAALLGQIPASPQLTDARKAIQKFMTDHPNGELRLEGTLAPSAYARLSCSLFDGNKPPGDQQQDAQNWMRFHDATVALMDMPFVKSLTYADWQQFNVLANHGAGVKGTPDRHNAGNWSAATLPGWNALNAPIPLIRYFLLNSADFMNLCDSLHELSNLTAAPTASAPQFVKQTTAANDALVLALLRLIMKNDVNNDYSKPAAAALLNLVNPQNVTAEVVTCDNSLTCKFVFN